MKEKQITIIPKKTKNLIDEETGIIVKKRVCAYARVSTDFDDQKNSFNAQLAEYESRIKRNPDWEFIKLYSDEGITGTSIKKRVGFQEMINDALNGKIDIILTKSISRFARNTVDCLKTIRELKEKGIIVQFEKENINTNDPNIEMALTIFASMAQEESKSISENVKWGVRSRMKRGVVHYYKNILGYDKLEDGSIIINNDEKEIVKQIFNLYISGYSFRQICSLMEEKGYQTGLGSKKWNISYISNILQNEKYCGDVLLQKTICRDFLTHKREKNNGCEQQYLISGNHDPIISREMFEYVQNLRKYRNENHDTQHNYNWNPFAGIIYCEDCYRHVNMVITHPNTISEKRVLTCKVVSKRKNNYIACKSKPLNYFLALNALKDAYHKYHEFDKSSLTLILKSLNVDQTLFSKYFNQRETINNKIEACKIDLKKLIASHIENPIPDYDLQYKTIKKKIDECKKELDDYEKQIYLKNENYFKQYRIAKFLIENEEISLDIVQEWLLMIIKRSDNSLRFVAGNKKMISTEKEALIPYFLSLSADYTGYATYDDLTIKYDVVNYGGNENE